MNCYLFLNGFPASYRLSRPNDRGEHVRPALEKTLLDLKTDYVDLYMMHWPTAFVNVPYDGTKRGFPMDYEPDQVFWGFKRG